MGYTYESSVLTLQRNTDWFILTRGHPDIDQSHVVNIAGFEGHTFSVTTINLATHKQMSMDCVSIKQLMLQKQLVDQS